MSSEPKPAPVPAARYDPAIVRRVLDEVLSSPEFQGSERLIRFLRFVVEETLDGRGPTLKESRLGHEVFERAVDYDPKSDPIVRVQARRLRAKLEQYYGREGAKVALQIDLPKGSYIPQFLEPVPPPVEETPAESAMPAAVQERRVPAWLWAAGAALVVLSAAAFLRLSRGPAVYTLNMRPLTNQRGYQTTPAFSPDGKMIAYAWDGAAGGNWDIYFQRVDSGESRRLTSSVKQERRPVWAPDGLRVAFVRNAEPGGFEIIAMPVAGSGEHRVAEIKGDLFNPPRVDWSADGKWIYTNEIEPGSPSRLIRISLDTGQHEVLTNPAAGTPGDTEAVLSPDGRWVAFCRSREVAVQDIYRMSAGGGNAEPVTRDGAGTMGFAWGSGGRTLLVSSRRRSSLQRLWRFDLDGGEPVSLTEAAVAASWPAVGPGGRIAYASRFFDVNVWEFALEGGTPPRRAIASNVLDSGAQYSPDGSRIAFRSNRSGDDEVWVSDANGESPVRISNFRGPVTGSAQWSPDGETIALESRPYGNADIFLAPAGGGEVRRFTTSSSNEILARFAPSGTSVYFASDRSGTWQIWNQPLGGTAEARQVTRNGGFACYPDASGQWLYYVKGPEGRGLWRMPAAGGEEQNLLPDFDGSMWGNWALLPNGRELVYVEPVHKALMILGVETGKSRKVADLAFTPVYRDTGLGASPDGKRVVVSQVEHAGSNIYISDDEGVSRASR